MMSFNSAVWRMIEPLVYGKSSAVPCTEDVQRVPGSAKIDRWCYSTSKAVGEHFCFAFQKLGLPIVGIRYFNV